jgi:hypothetical protein
VKSSKRRLPSTTSLTPPPPGANRSRPLNRSASSAPASRCPTPVSPWNRRGGLPLSDLVNASEVDDVAMRGALRVRHVGNVVPLSEVKLREDSVIGGLEALPVTW